MIDFTLDPRLEDIRRRTRDFVDTHILPVEADRANWDDHDNIADAPLQALRARGRRGCGARRCRRPWAAWACPSPAAR